MCGALAQSAAQRTFNPLVPSSSLGCSTKKEKEEDMDKTQIANVCFWASLTSVIGSIAVWSLTGDTDPAHAERFGIFVGLWAPTLMGLANWFKS